jgi:anion-transporting  ArsA/GET3 family ATPase
MYDGFKVRAANVKALLSSPDAAFVLVTSPAALTIDEALFFHKALGESQIKTAAVIVNRLQEDPRKQGGVEQQPAIAEALARAQIVDGSTNSQAANSLSVRLAKTLQEQAALADIDRAQVQRLAHQLGQTPIYLAPRLRRDIHDLNGLWQIHDSLGALQ